MTVQVLIGGLLGGALAVGIILVAVALPRPGGHTDLIARVEPYLDKVATIGAGARTPAEPWGLSGALAAVRWAGRGVDRLVGGSESVASRLQRAGLPADVEGFRIQQVLWGAACVVLVTLAGSVAVWTRGVSLAALVVVSLCAALGGVLLRDQLL